MRKISIRLTRNPKIVVLIAVLLMIPGILGVVATRINYDILTYLPPDLDSTKGEVLLEEPFHDAATSMLIVEDMPPRYTDNLLQSIKKIPGVSNAIWVSNLAGIQIPTNMLPDELRDAFFSGNTTMMLIQYDMPGATEQTMEAISQVRAQCNEHCFLAGFSALIKDTRDLVDREVPFYIMLAVAMSLVAMWLTMDSWLLPVVFLSSIGLAIVYNFGSNVFLGEISYITKAIAAVLQLGVTMDYSIFLFRRYEEERPRYEDKRDAMAQAIQSAFVSLSGSSLTTIAGFAALCFMQLLLGRDIGIVMAKGVVIGVATVILILPSMILVTDKWIEKSHHRSFMPDFNGLNEFIIRNRRKFAALFLLILAPAIYSQAHTAVFYKLDEALPQDMPSIVATNMLKDKYDMASTHFIILNDNISGPDMKDMTDRLKDLDGIETLISYDQMVSPDIPDFFIPQDIKDIFKQGGKQLVMINSGYPTASDKVSQQLSQIKSIVKRYDPGAYITGEAALTDDLIKTASVDFQKTSYISIAAIFLIVAIVFQSITLPVILVAAIELAIFVNQGIPYFTGSVIPFITPTIIGCVQLGATVDYAILLTSRFHEELQNGKDRKEAIRIAASTSDTAIITSSLVLFCATLGVGLISKIEIISNICITLARGALISAAVSIFIMPPILLLFEPLIARTSRNWTNKAPAAEKEYALSGRQDSK